MAENERRGNNITITWGIFILSLGVVLLLQATGVLEWRLWGTLWKFWPVLIIALGLAIIIPRRLGWLLAATEIVALGICVWVSAVQYAPHLSGNPMIGEQHFTYPLIGVERAGPFTSVVRVKLAVALESYPDNHRLLEDAAKMLTKKCRSETRMNAFDARQLRAALLGALEASHLVSPDSETGTPAGRNEAAQA